MEEVVVTASELSSTICLVLNECRGECVIYIKLMRRDSGAAPFVVLRFNLSHSGNLDHLRWTVESIISMQNGVPKSGFKSPCLPIYSNPFTDAMPSNSEVTAIDDRFVRETIAILGTDLFQAMLIVVFTIFSPSSIHLCGGSAIRTRPDVPHSTHKGATR
jgi:hypothetical protein